MPYDFVFANALRFDLPSEFFDNETTLDVPSAVASQVSSALANGGRLPLVLADSATITPTTTIEIVYATSADTSANTLTVTRGEEGTTPATWPSGTVAQNAITSGVLNTLKTDFSASEDDFQILLLEANQLLDATDPNAQVEVLVPYGMRAWTWRIFFIPIELELNGNTSGTFDHSIGITSGGTEISNFAGGLSSNQIGERQWLYTDNGKVGSNDRFYVHVENEDTESAVNKGRVIIEATVGPQSKSGF